MVYHFRRGTSGGHDGDAREGREGKLCGERSRGAGPMLTFATAVFLLIVTPGPGVLSTAGTGAAHGLRPGLAYVAGLFVGTNLVALAVITGVAAVVLGVPALRWGLAIASVCYLGWLAARIALAGARIAFARVVAPPRMRDGIALQLINPKAYAVNTVLFSGFPFYPSNLGIETALKLIIANLIWVPIHLGWLYAGIALHRLDLPPRRQRVVNMAMAAALMGVVVLALVGAGQAA